MHEPLANRASDEARSLPQWLTYLESIHPTTIELGLDRLKQVFQRLSIDFKPAQVITVAGTNGKGTTCAFIEQALLSKGKSVAVYSSPHLIDYRERVRVNGAMLSEQAHCAAFSAVEQARGEISLTYFEFGTLAGMLLMADAGVDYVLLEVGLGGRLDAVNIVDPDLAIITGIDIDHKDWLGDNREDIGREKAGIFRDGIPVVIGDPNPPMSVLQVAEAHRVKALYQGKDFSFQTDGALWQWQLGQSQFSALPMPHIPMQNVSTALAALHLLGIEFVLAELQSVIERTHLAGRMQVIQQQPRVIVDVAHNPQATQQLASQLGAMNYRQLYLVVGMLKDKDIEQSLAPLFDLPEVHWLVSSPRVPRAADPQVLKKVLVGQRKVVDFCSIHDAYTEALSLAQDDDLIVVFGSFFTVAEILAS